MLISKLSLLNLIFSNSLNELVKVSANFSKHVLIKFAPIASAVVKVAKI